MIWTTTALAFVLTAVIIFQGVFILKLSRTHQDERQALLDRIQAPSFQEYTNKVVREKKAEQKTEEPQPIHDFIS